MSRAPARNGIKYISKSELIVIFHRFVVISYGFPYTSTILIEYSSWFSAEDRRWRHQNILPAGSLIVMKRQRTCADYYPASGRQLECEIISPSRHKNISCWLHQNRTDHGVISMYSDCRHHYIGRFSSASLGV